MNGANIHFTKHAQEKFEVLARHSFKISKAQVLKTVFEPETFDLSRSPLVIFQRKINQRHYLRVVCKKQNNCIKIITFYPARIRKYATRIYKTKN